jgi:hypothetical protein
MRLAQEIEFILLVINPFESSPLLQYFFFERMLYMYIYYSLFFSFLSVTIAWWP